MTRRLQLVATEDDWRDQAACRSADADPRWFGPVESRTDWSGVWRAFEFCRRCPVTEQCWAAAQSDPYSGGVYGGRYKRPPSGR